MTEKPWFAYLAEDASGRLYAGASTDPERRCREHGGPRGARSLRGRGPVRLRWASAPMTRSAALRLEAALKALSRAERLALAEGPLAPGERSRPV